jgi:hypothetical protein
MASLRGRARHKLFALKRRVHLGKLSPGDAVLIALTAVRASHEHLHAKARKMVEAGDTPTAGEFVRVMGAVLTRRRGSFYAALVTAIDHKRVFHADRFAVSLKRLGIFDDVESSFAKTGQSTFAHTVAIYGPWFWADLVTRELINVKKEVTNPVERAVAMFTEDVAPLHIDELIESNMNGFAPQSPLGAMAYGAANFQVGSATRQSFQKAFRDIARSPNIEILDENSSIDAILENFYQHLLSDANALRRVLPQAQYKGVKLSPSQIYQVFQTTAVRRGIFKAFLYGYDKPRHAIRLAALYRGVDQYGLRKRIISAVRSKTGKILDDAGAAAIVTSVVGLFYAFVADKRGQTFPMMKSLAS